MIINIIRTMKKFRFTFVVTVVALNLVVIGSISRMETTNAVEDAKVAEVIAKQEVEKAKDEYQEGYHQVVTLEREAMIAEKNKRAEEKRVAEAKAAKAAEEQRIAEEKVAEAKRVVEERMLAEKEAKEAEEKKVAEEKKAAEQKKEREQVVAKANTTPTRGNVRVSTKSQGGLLNINNPTASYKRQVVEITGSNRDDLERLVMGESGGEKFTGSALVAQAIKDTMIKDGIYNVRDIKRIYKYSAPLSKVPTQSVKDAVSYIFDEGGYAVKHRVIYFYAPKLVYSKWHETMPFIVEYGCHKFFDTK